MAAAVAVSSRSFSHHLNRFLLLRHHLPCFSLSFCTTTTTSGVHHRRLPPTTPPAILPLCPRSFIRTFTAPASSSSSSGRSHNNTNSTAAFDWSSDDDDNAPGTDENTNKKKATAAAAATDMDKSKLPPPYDPFSKKPVVEEPRDPSNLQEVFHRMRTEGLTNYAIKMFDALSKDGLTHEALQLFALIKDKGTMPDVVAHTAVLEAYANAGGHSKDAIRTYERMLAAGVSPNAYTFSVLIKGVARDGQLAEARKFVLEMMKRGMRPNVGTYVTVFEAYLRNERADDARHLLEEMRQQGFAPDEKSVRETLSKRGPIFRSIMNLLFGK